MLSITAYLDFVNALYHLVRGFLLPGSGDCLIFSRPQICAGLLKFQETSDLGAVHQGAVISAPPTPPPAAPQCPPGAGWYLYPPAALGAIGGALRAAVVYLCGEPENVWLVWPDSGVSL